MVLVGGSEWLQSYTAELANRAVIWLRIQEIRQVGFEPSWRRRVCTPCAKGACADFTHPTRAAEISFRYALLNHHTLLHTLHITQARAIQLLLHIWRFPPATIKRTPLKHPGWTVSLQEMPTRHAFRRSEPQNMPCGICGPAMLSTTHYWGYDSHTQVHTKCAQTGMTYCIWLSQPLARRG